MGVQIRARMEKFVFFNLVERTWVQEVYLKRNFCGIDVKRLKWDPHIKINCDKKATQTPIAHYLLESNQKSKNLH